MSDVDDDLSADTARFQAFARRQDDDLPAPWHMRVPGSKIGLLAGIVVGVAVLAAIVAAVLIG
ncbi:MAG: hypothetical protein ACXVW7_13280 [Trebonia sp.]|jgi:hypothetical protein